MAPLNPHPRISQVMFFSFLWSGVALSLCLVVLRFGIRWKLFRQLFWDDACVAVAMIVFLAQAVAWSIYSNGLYLAYDVATGRVFPTPDLVNEMLKNIKVQLGALVLFFTAVWAIKLAFLIFFRRIGARVQGYKIWWWWTVLGLVISTYLISVGMLPYRCMAGSADYIVSHCVDARSVDHYYAVFYAHMAFDVGTDLCLVSIPVFFLWNVKIPLKQKLGLIGLFSLTLCIVAVAIVRLAINGKQNGITQDAAWLAFWAIIEITIAIIVACLGSFRQLFTRSGSSKASTNNSSKQNMMRSVKQTLNNVSSTWHRGHTKTPSHMALMTEQTAYSHDSEERMMEKNPPKVEITRTEVPLKRVSQAHVAHYSSAPTERRYMVVHPGDESESEKTAPKYGFI